MKFWDLMQQHVLQALLFDNNGEGSAFQWKLLAAEMTSLTTSKYCSAFPPSQLSVVSSER